MFTELPKNDHGVTMSSILLPTNVPVCPGGETSLEFVGDPDTFVVVFGMLENGSVAGGFLTPDGPGFTPTWEFNQLMDEVPRGVWQVVPLAQVRGSAWMDKIGQRLVKAPELVAQAIRRCAIRANNN